jgi:hypothetical protein
LAGAGLIRAAGAAAGTLLPVLLVAGLVAGPRAVGAALVLGPTSGYYLLLALGFGVRVGRHKKTYFAEGRVARNTRRVTIGSADVFSCEQARREAQKLLGEMAAGKDPNAAKARHRAELLTLDSAAREFFEMRKLADSTATDYRRILKVCFGDWLRRPMKDISSEMVLRRFRVLSDERGPGYANLSMRVLRSIWNFARARFMGTDGSYILPDCPVKRLSEARMWHRQQTNRNFVPTCDHPLGHCFAAFSLAACRLSQCTKILTGGLSTPGRVWM